MKKLVQFLAFSCMLFAFDMLHAQDQITSISAPNPVTQGKTEVVTVNYVASVSRDIVVSIQENGGSWTTYGSARVTVSAGTGSVNVNLPVSASIPVATDVYKIGSFMAPVGGAYPTKVAEYSVANISAKASTAPVDRIIGITAPNQVSKGATITVTVNYEATVSRDIVLNLLQNTSPWTNYGTAKLNVAAGTGTVNIDLPVSPDIPVATSAYTLSVVIAPVDGSWANRINEMTKANIDAVVATSITSKSIEMGTSVFPNPAHGIATIKSETVIKNVSIYTVTGKLMLNKQVESNEYSLGVTSYSKGLYVLSVTNEKGTSTTKLVVK